MKWRDVRSGGGEHNIGLIIFKCLDHGIGSGEITEIAGIVSSCDDHTSNTTASSDLKIKIQQQALSENTFSDILANGTMISVPVAYLSFSKFRGNHKISI